MEEVDVGNGIADVCAEIGDSPSTGGPGKVVVHPAEKDFFG